MTAEREETKYLVPPVHWERLATELSLRLPGHRFTGAGANRLPDAHHYVTTIYFDTPSRALFRAADATVDRNLKIRAKEYYDLHPSLAEVATDPAQIVRYQPWLWFEIKRREGSRTRKQRFRLPKGDVGAVLRRRAHHARRDARRGGRATTSSDAMETCRALGEPLSSVCLVNYRRLSWQSDEAELRVTLRPRARVVRASRPISGRAGRRWCAARWGRRSRWSRTACWRSSAAAQLPAWLGEVLRGRRRHPCPVQQVRVGLSRGAGTWLTEPATAAACASPRCGSRPPVSWARTWPSPPATTRPSWTSAADAADAGEPHKLEILQVTPARRRRRARP